MENHPPADARLWLNDSISIQEIDGDLLVFDPEQMHYHSLNGVAAAIWMACDSAPDPATAAKIACQSVPQLSSDQATAAIEELLDIGLVRWEPEKAVSKVSRRTALKAGIAVATGAVGLPVIASISVPSSQAAASGGCAGTWICVSGGTCCNVNRVLTICEGNPCPCSGGRVCIGGQCLVPC
jgi:hypothetical protein